MSYEGQLHHPHERGYPPSPQLLLDSQSTLPPNLTLLQAHWFVRHGERAPVRQRMVGLGQIPAVFELCSIGRNFTSAVTTLAPLPSSSSSSSSSSLQPSSSPSNPFLSSLRHTTSHSSLSTTSPHSPVSPTPRQMPVRRFTEDPSSTSTSSQKPTKGGLLDCYWGELTDLGRQSTLRFGSILRSLYISSNFLPTSLDPSSVQFRSTNMPRTIESLHQIIEGLYPGSSQGVVEFRVRNWMDENLYPNTACKRLRALDALSIQSAAKTHNPSLATLDEVLRPVLGKGIMKSAAEGGGLRIDSSPRANGVLDTLMVCRAHGIEVPEVFNRREVLEVLERGVVHEWFDGYLSPEFRRLAMGRLFSDLHSHLSSKISNPSTDPLKLAINSCHDTSIGGILNTLDAFDGRWPPFTSNLGIELYASKDSSSSLPSFSSILPSSTKKAKHFVRVLYNGRELELPACKAEGNHLEGTKGKVCTFEAFEGVLKKWGMSQAEWEKECGE